MLSMLIGRPVSAICGLLVLVLLSRVLTPGAYGAYFAVWAVAEIVILASNAGLLHAVYRYVSARETLAGVIQPEGPVWRLLAWRLLSLMLPALLLLSLPAGLSAWLGLPQHIIWLLPMLAAICVGEGLARFIEAIFDSMLCQGRSQLTLTLRTVLRLSGVLLLMAIGEPDITRMLLVEVAAAGLGALIALGLLLHLWVGRERGQPVTPPAGIRRMTRFALPAYVAELLGLTYGPNALKLALGGVAGPTVLAVFGFAYSLAAVIQRYMPSNLLAGIFRPVFVAAARREDAQEVLPGLVGLSIKLNWLLILPVLGAACFGGSPLLAKISDGVYADAGLVLVLILTGLLMLAVHQILSMYCLALEDSWPPLLATAASVISLPMGIWLAHVAGAAGIAAAFLLSELIWVFTCLLILRFLRKSMRGVAYGSLGRMLLAALPGIALAWLLHRYQLAGWFVQAGVAAFTMPLVWLLMRPMSEREMQWLQIVFPQLHKLRKKENPG